MATASDIITRAFARIGIKASETSLEADEMQDGLSLLNDMIAEWETVYHLGASPVTDVADVVTIPRHANKAVIESLAIMLAPEYSRVVSNELMASASASMRNLLNTTIDLSNVDIPSTLPYGEGNELNSGTDAKFFPQGNKANF